MRVGRRVNQGVENTFLAGFHMTDPRSKLDKALEIKEKGNELLKAGETKKVLVSTPANLLPLFRGVKCEQWRVVSILKVAETPGGGGGCKNVCYTPESQTKVPKECISGPGWCAPPPRVGAMDRQGVEHFRPPPSGSGFRVGSARAHPGVEGAGARKWPVQEKLAWYAGALA